MRGADSAGHVKCGEGSLAGSRPFAHTSHDYGTTKEVGNCPHSTLRVQLPRGHERSTACGHVTWRQYMQCE
eukprot:5732953-Prymnesium_polylepis.1